MQEEEAEGEEEVDDEGEGEGRVKRSNEELSPVQPLVRVAEAILYCGTDGSEPYACRNGQ